MGNTKPATIIDTVGDDLPLNGHMPEPAAEALPQVGFRAPRRERWFVLPGEYAEWKIRIWVSHPGSIMVEARVAIAMDDYDKMAELLGRVYLEHNGWQDEEGTPYAQPQYREFWEAIPDEVVTIMMALLDTAKAELPNSIRQRRRV